MANRFVTPSQQFADATGTPYAGGSLTFYASGTSTLLTTYSDSALSIANTNPVVLDSAGRAGDIFMQNLAYKVVLADANGNQIWTKDPVYASDFSTAAQFQSGSGSPNGVLAGTAGSATIKANSYWDFTNNILYVCTTTGNAATAVWTAVNASSAASIIPVPAGRLTPTSVTPIISSDAIGATSLFYTPHVGNIIPIYNGSSFVPTVFTELTLSLVASHTANTIYDVFVFNNSGVLVLVTGPAWTTSTAGSGARGTGAGTTQLSRINGFLVNSVQITARNGATTYTVAANQATYVGSIYTDATAGQVTCHLSFGQNRKFGIWNAYNRVPIFLQAGDATASWTANTVLRASNNTPAAYSSTAFNVGSGTGCNGGASFTGLAEPEVTATFSQNVTPGGSGSLQIGINSVTVGTGMAGDFGGTASVCPSAPLIRAPSLGINNICCLEASTGASTMIGSAGGMLLQISYLG